jgi:hypothetical protein
MPHLSNIILSGPEIESEEIRSLQSEEKLPCSCEPPRQVAPKVESEVIIEISIS